MTFCRRSRSTLTRAGRAHANPPSPPRPPHAPPLHARLPPPKPGPRAGIPSPAPCAGTIPTSPATSTASCSRTTTTMRTRCSSCPSPRRPSTRTTGRSPRSSSNTGAARCTSSSDPSRKSSATPRTAPASGPPCTRTASSRATRRAPPTRMRHPPAPRSRTAATRWRPTARTRRCVRECDPPPTPSASCAAQTIYRLRPGLTRICNAFGSTDPGHDPPRARPIDDQHGRSQDTPRKPHTVSLHTTLYRLLSVLSSLSALPLPLPTTRLPQLLLFIFYCFLFLLFIRLHVVRPAFSSALQLHSLWVFSPRLRLLYPYKVILYNYAARASACLAWAPAWDGTVSLVQGWIRMDKYCTIRIPDS